MPFLHMLRNVVLALCVGPVLCDRWEPVRAGLGTYGSAVRRQLCRNHRRRHGGALLMGRAGVLDRRNANARRELVEVLVGPLR